MRYTLKIQRAIKFSVKTHEVYQKQKRKGKDIAYITHPLSVGIILSLAGAQEDVVIAGILHDTIEDSIGEKKVTKKMLVERFGDEVARMVEDVTENKKITGWRERKKEALEKIKHLQEDSLFVKSADVLANNAELVDDYLRNDDEIFKIFNAPEDKKENVLDHYLSIIGAILSSWKENPLREDLEASYERLRSMKDGKIINL